MAPNQAPAQEFPTVSQDDWRRLAGAAATRVALSDDGIALPPIAEGRSDTAALTQTPGWKIIQRLTGADADAVTREAAEAVAGGAHGIEVVFDGGNHPVRSRLPVAAARRLASELASLPKREISLRIDAGEATSSVAAAFTGPQELILADDPIARSAIRRKATDVATTIATAARLFSDGRVRAFAVADGRLWHAAGATEAQELAAVLATILAGLRLAAVPVGTGLAGTEVTLAADADLLLTIGKLRAARLLLLRMAEVLGASEPPHVHAESSWRMLTRREPKMNVLRSTVAALGAAIGGADSITVLPHDAASARDPGAARLARNTQAIIAAEARLQASADAGAGSGAIEAFTEALAAEAWRRFQAIEAEGGMLAAIEAGSIQRAVTASRRARCDHVMRGEAPILGVNVHIDGAAPVPGSAALDEHDDALAFARLAAPFETQHGTPS